MWYSVLRAEISVADKLIRAGSIYQVKKYTKDMILFIPQEGQSAKSAGEFKLPMGLARSLFTKPTQQFNDAVEESFMQSEANYC